MLRHLRVMPRDFQRISMLIYWPLIDIALWGFTAVWISSIDPALVNVSKTAMMIAALWQVFTRANFEISFSFLTELYAHNVVNLFGSPLKLKEWIAAVLLLAGISALFMAFFSGSLLYLFYGYSLLSLGWWLILVIALLFLSGISLGFSAASIIAYYGGQFESLVWMIAWAIAPFCGLFYDANVLPAWAQKVGSLFPMTHLFKLVRSIQLTASVDYASLYVAVCLAVFYALIGMSLFVCLFYQSKKKGLSRLVG